MPARSRRTPTEHKPLTPARPPLYCSTQAPVAELVDAPDSKSGGGNIVLVRVRPGAPFSIDRRPATPRLRGGRGHVGITIAAGHADMGRLLLEVDRPHPRLWDREFKPIGTSICPDV